MILVSGETFLKFSDYPFMYSIVAYLLKSIGLGFDDYQILYLGIAGALGTLLTIADPLGKMVESRLTKFYTPNNPEMEGCELSAVKTRSMKIEIDKVVGMWYFVFTVIGFIIAIILPFHFTDGLEFSNDDTISCNNECVKIVGIMGSGIVLFILGLAFRKIWAEMDDKLQTASVYQYVIGNDNAVVNSVDNMTRSMEVNDWATAKKWGEKILKEITLKKGKRELIIKSAEKIFSPLHEESTAIKNQIPQFNITRNYSALPNNKWNSIVNSSQNFMIDDATLRKRIHNFYNSINDFNELIEIVNDDFSNMINAIFSSKYNQRMSRISVDVYDRNNHQGFPVLDCAMFDVHPNTLMKNARVNGLSFQKTEENGNQHGEGLNFNDPSEFDPLWIEIRTKMENNEKFKKLKQLLHQIEIENSKLLTVYNKMIKWQWDV